MKRLFAGLLVFCLCGFAQAQGAPQSPKSDLALCEDLLSLDEQVRATAGQIISIRQGGLINSLIAKLKEQERAPDTRFGSSFHEVVLVLGSLRAKGAVGTMVGLVDTRLSGHPPGGAFGGPQIYYPVAGALVEIGGPNLNQWLFQRMVQPANDNLIRVTTWVLVQSNTEKVARWMIQENLDDITAALKRFGVTDTNPEKRNLERMLQLLDSKKQILPPENQPPPAR